MFDWLTVAFLLQYDELSQVVTAVVVATVSGFFIP